MRYIEKTVEPACLTTYRNIQQQEILPVIYGDFRDKRELNNYLREEQHYICCYCQQKLTHYQADKKGGAHNEHLVPQNGKDGDASKQMDYNNIYACCIDSTDMSETHQHCGASKCDNLIRGFIQEINCHTFFKYNANGEILPNGMYDEWKEYVENAAVLTDDIKDAFETIRTLNLNCHALVADRKGDFFTLLAMIRNMSKDAVNQAIMDFEKAKYYVRYIDMLLYYMRKKK